MVRSLTLSLAMKRLLTCVCVCVLILNFATSLNFCYELQETLIRVICKQIAWLPPSKFVSFNFFFSLNGTGFNFQQCWALASCLVLNLSENACSSFPFRKMLAMGVSNIDLIIPFIPNKVFLIKIYILSFFYVSVGLIICFSFLFVWFEIGWFLIRIQYFIFITDY